MRLDRLQKRGRDIAEHALDRQKRRLVRESALPSDIRLEEAAGGLILSGRALRKRYLTEPELRNAIR